MRPAVGLSLDLAVCAGGVEWVGGAMGGDGMHTTSSADHPPDLRYKNNTKTQKKERRERERENEKLRAAREKR